MLDRRLDGGGTGLLRGLIELLMVSAVESSGLFCGLGPYDDGGRCGDRVWLS